MSGGFVSGLLGLMALGSKGLMWAAGTAAALYALGKWPGKPIMRRCRLVRDRCKQILKRIDSIGENGGSTLHAGLHALRWQVAVLASIEEVVEYPTFVLDAHGEMARVNRAFRELTGWHTDDLMFGMWRAQLDPSARTDWDDSIAKGHLFEQACHVTKSNGETFPAIVSARPVKTDGKVISWRGGIVQIGDTPTG